MSESLPVRSPTDTDRERCLDILRAHCVDGRLTLSEFADRVELALAAESQAELGVLMGDLPRTESLATTRRRATWALSIFGSSRHRVRRRLSRRTFAMSLFGSSWLDLGDALLDAEETSVTAVAIFGTVKVVVPNGIAVDMTSLPVFGASKDESEAGRPVAGSPVIRVRSLPLFGAVKVLDTSWLSERY
jgi:hypothetical protein